MLELPCNGCTACCSASAPLDYSVDDVDDYHTMRLPNGGVGTLTGAGGWCVYADPGVGCRIYERRPQFCKDYDCRKDVDNENVCMTVRDAAAKLIKGEA